MEMEYFNTVRYPIDLILQLTEKYRDSASVKTRNHNVTDLACYEFAYCVLFSCNVPFFYLFKCRTRLAPPVSAIFQSRYLDTSKVFSSFFEGYYLCINRLSNLLTFKQPFLIWVTIEKVDVLFCLLFFLHPHRIISIRLFNCGVLIQTVAVQNCWSSTRQRIESEKGTRPCSIYSIGHIAGSILFSSGGITCHRCGTEFLRSLGNALREHLRNCWRRPRCGCLVCCG